MTNPSTQDPINVRSPQDLVEALPFLLGFHAENSLILGALSGKHLGRLARLDIPADPGDWYGVVNTILDTLGTAPDKAGRLPEQLMLIVVPALQPGERPADAMRRTQPLVAVTTTVVERLGLHLFEALCISGGRWWSYLDAACLDDEEGHPVPSADQPGQVTVTAIANGSRVPLDRARVLAALAPADGKHAAACSDALDQAIIRFREHGPEGERDFLDRAIHRLDTLFTAPSEQGELNDREAAELLLALRSSVIRDIAMEYAEPAHLPRALALWRNLARRCVDPYAEYSAAPLVLLGFAAWNAKDEAAARIVLHEAQERDPHYTMADTLMQLINNGHGPEPFLQIVREQRAERLAAES
ncbi:DUF4192 domain-containing protein [Kitasatospora sp. RB6PN24]|uniref:DUF4192 domain-containing protein n=1 Tax=Kitasatospora humi TaxID=2893891 RepID=UPI001E4E21DB|nr:DUF4192 domain-containing protein [Kitasatospora humi]MCC9309100.1 DUF4192 domain-containing protein [Kitasatospora humi]